MKLYTIINSRQPGMTGGVQAGHAVGEFSFWFSENDWVKDFYKFGPSPFIYLKGPNTHENMERLMIQLRLLTDQLELPILAFREPDLNNTMTAITLIVPTVEELDLQPVRDLHDILSLFHTAR